MVETDKEDFARILETTRGLVMRYERSASVGGDRKRKKKKEESKTVFDRRYNKTVPRKKMQHCLRCQYRIKDMEFDEEQGIYIGPRLCKSCKQYATNHE